MTSRLQFSLPVVVAATTALLPMTSCRKTPQEKSLQQLSERGYQFTPSDFSKAALDGNVLGVKEFLDAGMNVDLVDKSGNTALFRAAQMGQANAVKELLGHGAKVNFESPDGETPLIAAARNGNAKTVKALLDAGADPSRVSPKKWTALKAAAYAGHAGVVRLLAAKSGDSIDDALQLACIKGDTAVVDLLLNNGASVYARSPEGKTSLMFAAANGNREVVELLLTRGADKSAIDQSQRTAAQFAEEAKHPELAMLLNEPAAPVAKVKIMEGDETGEPEGGEVAGVALTAASTPSGNGGAVRLSNTRLEGVANGSAQGLKSSLQFRDYHQRQLPLLLDSITEDGDQAVIRVLSGRQEAPLVVAAGQPIGNTGFELIKTTRKFIYTKMGKGALVDASRVLVRDHRTGQEYQMIKDTPAQSNDLAATLRVGETGQTYEVRPDDQFTVGDGQEVKYRVQDIRPTQVVLENLENGETVTVAR